MSEVEDTSGEVGRIREALRAVIDPHVGMSVVDMAMVREIVPGVERVQVKMILTSPFCPLASMILSQVQQTAERIAGRPVDVELLKEPWSPAMMDQHPA